MKMLTAFAPLLGVSTLAMAQPPLGATHEVVTRDGITYDYMVTTNRRGYREIVGRDSRGARFTLRVAGSSVSGRYGDNQVSFYSRPRPERPVEVAVTTR
jgi:hypothetical protein